MTDATNTIDPWSTETGLVSDYEGTVVDAWFGTDPKVGGGLTLIAHWKLATDSPENPEVEERWTCGPDWASYDGGETAEHPKGPDKRFNKNSQYGHLIDKIVDLGAGGTLAERGTPRTAKVFVGTKWYMEAEVKPYSFKDKDDPTKIISGESSRNYPTKFLGVGDVTVPATQSPSPTAGATPSAPSTVVPTAEATASPSPAPAPAAAPVASGDPFSLLDPTVAAQAKLLAKAKSYSDWVDAMLELPGVAENNDLVMQLAEEGGLYASLRA